MAANPAVPAVLMVPKVPDDDALQLLTHIELGNLLTALNEVPARKAADRLARLTVLRGLQEAPGRRNGVQDIFHQYAPDSMLANVVARHYALADLGKLPAPRWSKEMIMSPAAWPLLVQAKDYGRRDFADTEERISPALQPLRLALRAYFKGITEEVITEITAIYRKIAIEFLCLNNPTASEIQDLISQDLKSLIEQATNLVQDAYAEAEALPSEARTVLTASRVLGVQSLPSHMTGVATAMMKAIEKKATGSTTATAPTKRGRDELPEGFFRCQRCNGWFVDLPGETPHAKSRQHLNN